MHATPAQRWFLIVGEACLGGVAFAAGWWLGVDPFTQLRPEGAAILYGVLATLPMLLTFWLLIRGVVPVAGSIRAAVDEWLAPFFACWTLPEIALAAAAAGLGEELLFRGLLQDALTPRFGWLLALVFASVAFGLVHLITVEYALYATLVGAYLGGLYLLSENLMAPIVAHSVYDLVALLYIRRKGLATQ